MTATLPQRALLLPLVVVVALGIWARVGGLGEESVSHDEAHSALMARLPATEIVRASATADNNPPLYYLILHGFTHLVGTDRESWLRAPSTVFGIAGVGATFLVAKELVGRDVTLWATLLIAFSPFHVQFSREARMYSLLYLGSALSTCWFARLRNMRSTDAMVWVGATLATLYAHTLGVFVLVAQHLCWLALRVISPDAVAPLPRWLALNALVGVVAAPWGGVVLEQLRRINGVFWITPPYLTQPLDTFAALAGSFPVLALLSALAGIGLITLVRTPATANGRVPGRAAAVILVIWAGVPVIAPWLLSYVSVPILAPRIAIAALAPLVIAAAVALAGIRRPAAVIVGGALVLMSGQQTWHYTHSLTKDDWRSAAAYITSEVQPDDLLLFHEGSRRKGFEYYVPEPKARIAGFPDRRFREGETVQPAELPGLEHLVDAYRRVWLVLASSNDPDHLIERGLSTRFDLVERREYRHLVVERFEQRRAARKSAPAAR